MKRQFSKNLFFFCVCGCLLAIANCSGSPPTKSRLQPPSKSTEETPQQQLMKKLNQLQVFDTPLNVLKLKANQEQFFLAMSQRIDKKVTVQFTGKARRIHPQRQRFLAAYGYQVAIEAEIRHGHMTYWMPCLTTFKHDGVPRLSNTRFPTPVLGIGKAPGDIGFILLRL